MKRMKIAFGLMCFTAFFCFASPSPGQNKTAVRSAPEAVVLREGTAVPLRLTKALTSETQKVGPQLEVAQDVTMGDLIVIPRGSQAVYSVGKKGARRGLRPGSLDLQVGGVKAIDGEEIPLWGGSQAQGREAEMVGCSDGYGGCGLVVVGELSLLFMKGHKAKVPAGKLLWAWVERDTRLEKAVLADLTSQELRKRPAGSPGVRARIHFYKIIDPTRPWEQEPPDTRSSIRIDGKDHGKLRTFEYGCVELEPGLHTVGVDNNQDLRLEAQPDADYFVRLTEHHSGPSSNTIADITRGYEFGQRQGLVLSRRLKASCPSSSHLTSKVLKNIIAPY